METSLFSTSSATEKVSQLRCGSISSQLAEESCARELQQRASPSAKWSHQPKVTTAQTLHYCKYFSEPITLNSMHFHFLPVQ